MSHAGNTKSRMLSCAGDIREEAARGQRHESEGGDAPWMLPVEMLQQTNTAHTTSEAVPAARGGRESCGMACARESKGDLHVYLQDARGPVNPSSHAAASSHA